MSDFVKTSDGRIAFRKSQFHDMTTNKHPSRFNSGYELTIWTDANKGGRIISYGIDKAARDKAAKEIQEQL